jgi:hypothetical protein
MSSKKEKIFVADPSTPRAAPQAHVTDPLLFFAVVI